MLAEGFSIQCGVLFRFGRKTNESAGTLLKSSAASAAVKKTKRSSHSEFV